MIDTEVILKSKIKCSAGIAKKIKIRRVIGVTLGKGTFPRNGQYPPDIFLTGDLISCKIDRKGKEWLLSEKLVFHIPRNFADRTQKNASA